MNDTYKNIEHYHPNKKRKILIVTATGLEPTTTWFVNEHSTI